MQRRQDPIKNIMMPSVIRIFLTAVFLFLLTAHKSVAQASKIDSIQQVIDETLKKDVIDSCELAGLYGKLVTINRLDRKMEEALEVIHSIKELDLKQCHIYTQMLIMEGSLLTNMRLIDSAITTFQKALPYAYNRYLKGRVYFAMGAAQLMARHEKSGIISNRKAVQIFKSENDTGYLISALNNLANCFSMSDQYDSSIYYFKESLRINKGKHLTNGPKSASLCELGRVYVDLEQIDSAEHYYDLVLAHGDENFSFPGYAVVYQNIGKLKFRLGQYDLAETYLNKALERAKQVPGMDTYPNINYLLAALAVRRNDIELANMHMGRADTLYLRQMKSNKDVAIAEAETKFDVSEKELRNELLAKENEVATQSLKLQRTIITVVVSVLILSLVFAWFVWNQRRKVNSLNKALDKHNDELKTLIDEKDNYMSLLAHDLRSPIASVVGLSDLILEDEVEEVREHAEDIRKSAIGSLQIMNEVLDIYRFETQQEDILFESVDVEKICQHIAKRYEPLATAKGQKLLMSQGVEATLMSNSTLLKSILGNLISNAIKYNNHGGTCSLELTNTHIGVIIEVSDDGPGFPEKDREKVFGKFQKLTAQPTGNESSSGLGLYMVKLMVERLNGGIELESRQGKGANFIITLPTQKS